MAGIAGFLKNAWNKEPVIMVSCAIGLMGDVYYLALERVIKVVATSVQPGTNCVALPFISPITKYSGMINSAVPYNYPVPVRDDGNMPDVPVHPREAKGNNLEWLKNL